MPPPPPGKKLAVVACMDARVNVERILGLEDGDAHIVRNAGALVTDDVKRSLETSRSLGTERVILMLHTDCGARSGDLDALAREAAAEIGGDARAMVYDVDTRELRDAGYDRARASLLPVLRFIRREPSAVLLRGPALRPARLPGDGGQRRRPVAVQPCSGSSSSGSS